MTTHKIQPIAGLQRTLDIFHQPGTVAEVRILNIPGRGRPYTASGYFDDFAAAAEAAAAFDDECSPAGIYFTLNPPDTALLARSPNTLTPYPEARVAVAEALTNGIDRYNNGI